MELTDLPNIGPVLADNLRRVEITTPGGAALYRCLPGVASYPHPGGQRRLLPPAYCSCRGGGGYP